MSVKAPKIGNGPINIPPAAFTFEFFEVIADAKIRTNPRITKITPIINNFAILKHKENDRCHYCPQTKN